MFHDDPIDPVDPLTTAIDELKFTIQQATACDTANRPCADEILSHCQDLADDIDSIKFDNQTNRKTKLEAEAVIKEGRRLRRSLNKKALVLLDQQKQTKSEQTSSSTSQPSNPHPKTKKSTLQKLNVPKFNGDFRKFRPFFDTFQDEVENNTDLSEAAKWIYLRESLEGKAAELVAHLPQIPETRAVALELLHAHYGGKNKTIADLYRQLQNTTPAQMSDEQLRFTQAKVEGILLTLENLGHTVNDNAFVKTIVLDKFPHDFKCTFVTDEEMSLQDIRRILHQRIKARESLASQSFLIPKSNTRPSVNKPGQRQGRNFQERPITCLFCSGLHWSDECPVFKTAETRLQQIPDRCPRCLRPKHEGNCGTEKRCVYCDLTTHNRAVCPKKFPTTVSLALIEKERSDTQSNNGVYLTFCLEVSTPNSTKNLPIRAVIDTGGAKNIITNQLAEKLHIKPDPNSQLEFLSLDGIELPPARRALVPLTLQTHKQELINIQTYITNSIASDLPAANIDKFRNSYPQFDNLYIPPTGQGQPVQLLLGKDSLAKIFTLSNSVEVNDQLQLLSTRFGWIILGSQSLAINKQHSSHLSFHTQSENEIKLMWDLDIIGLGHITAQESTLEEIAIQKFNESITMENGRYFVGWPWRDYPPLLNENYGLALGRLKSLYTKLSKDKSLLQQYHSIITQQETDNIVEKIPNSNYTEGKIKHYIPHHPVIRPQSDSTKIRLVYDASARLTKQDKSLNDNLLKGSSWVSEIISILLRFRKHPVALTADIKQAFLQIGIQPQDRDAVRFLWLKDPFLPPQNNNLQIYRFQRVAFGIISSPFLLYATILHHLQQYDTPTASILRRDLYADNLVTSLPPTIDTTEFYNEIQDIFTTMSMDMTKWASNDTQLRHYIPPEKQLPNQQQTVLGLGWDTHNDTLKLKKVDFTPNENLPLTKRRALQMTAKVFDPLGWATPITLLAKSFIRRLWQSNTTWDQLLPDEQAEWNIILNQLKQASTIELQRPFPNITSTEYQLAIHTFVDASAIAYAAVTYITITTEKLTKSTILAARNRLTPNTKLTIPRLELLAILIGCRLTNTILRALQLPSTQTSYIWSDSQCALSWIKSNKILPAVVNKQLDEIRSNINFQYNYVPSEQNYADVASRGTTYDELHRIQWWTGPTWILHPQQWPVQTVSPSLPTPETHLLLPAKSPEPIISTDTSLTPGICTLQINNFSTLTALLRRTAFCVLAVNKLLRQNFIQTQTKLDYNIALKLWLKWAQQTSYPEYYLNKKDKSKLFRNLHIISDNDGILRCLTRLHHADTTEDTKQPILLIRQHYLTRLIILQTHTNAQHSGINQTLALLRTKYYLPQGRREINHIIKTYCFICRKATTTTYTAPPPAPLPEFRVTRAEYPFECSGIDLFGPLRTRPCEPNAQPTKQKRWVILFTCTITRAVHLELVTDISSNAILEGIRRFTARRGTPRLIICDSAPQFHVINRKLLNLWPTVFESADGISYFASRQITWKFIPPHSPWMGGHYERLISIIKKALTTTYGNLIMPDRQLETSLIEVEAMLNSRPLTYVDQNINTTLITPNSFLNIKFPAIPLPNSNFTHDRLLNLWHASQKHLNTFWETWSNDYLLALRDRHDKLAKKQKESQTIPAVNDLVLIAEPEKQRSSWRLARIERLIRSSDNKIRSVQLILGNNSRVVRPVIKLAPLHLRADLPEAVGQITADKTAIVVSSESNDNLPSAPTTTATSNESSLEHEPDDDTAEIIEIELDWDQDDTATNNPTTTKVSSSTSE